MSNSIFEGLNNKQRQAVEALVGPVLVISGPGSGKTKCLTHRIANLITNSIDPSQILAVTFTNKAAGEMRARIARILNYRETQISGLPLIGTFHSICLRILRREIERLGYGRNFTIFDTDDQLALVKRSMLDLELDTKRFNPRSVLSKISKAKTELVGPEHYDRTDFFSNIVGIVYERYQSELRKTNALDFDDLIGLTVRLFRDYPEVLSHYHNLWRYILVDEYQDTSHDQYQLVKLLAAGQRNLFCIGDDAQSIYQFRQADIRNILNFQKDYPEATVILLEQNYRSTKNIIAAAQNIISHNQAQIPKELWTENDGGEKIQIIEALNERHEAAEIISRIEEWTGRGYRLSDIAILYRTHAQSRAMEEAMIMRNMPYQIFGGIKFYERKEIKDILAYLKVITNPADTISFERIINIPARGIGQVGLERILNLMAGNIIEAISARLSEGLPPKQALAHRQLASTLSDLAELQNKKKLSSFISSIIDKIDYEDYLKEFSSIKSDDFENFEERMENLRELRTVAKKYDNLPGRQAAQTFLEEIALLQESDKIKTNDKAKADRLNLMTTHASKGLEFPIVCVIGFEEGLLPHSRSLLSASELEEERRLCYVAITRAKEHLVLTYTRFRSIFGSTEHSLPSRFLSEIPTELIDRRAVDFDYIDM